MKKTQIHRDGAYALIVVLSAILLCALMVVILMERGTLGMKSASSYSHGVKVRALSDMVQSLVKAQIHDATTLNQLTDTPLARRDVWASQPGAIRVYTPAGALREIFKLYSSAELRTTLSDLSLDVPTNWASRPSEYTDLNEPVNDGVIAHYPILNPSAASLNPGASGIIDGFSIQADAPTSTGGNMAPMPVRWMYVLQDGTLCQLGDSRINLQTNPIIGRIAFWTDDETCKVNINTASPVTANSFWDMPRTRSTSEINSSSWRQPAQNEYQRYPGHPAMVSLRSILGGLGGMSSSDYYSLTPRYYWGGSEDGAIQVNASRSSLLRLKEDRAYATVDELLFRSLPSDSSSTLRSQPTPAQVGSLHFFLSASSRAPELNLFGQPRVSIWPIHEENNELRRTPYDQLIAFCSTIGGRRYYFTRSQPLDPTYDYSGIERNRELYAYLQRLTAAPVPGFSGSATFLSKYGNDRDQILTQIFDYIRIVNLNESYQGKPTGFRSYTSDWKLSRFSDAETAANTTQDYPRDGALRGAGLVVPIEIGDTRGMGRFPVIAETGLLFINHSQKKPSEPLNPTPSPVPPAPHPENREQLEAMLVLETITPAFGYMPWIGKDLNVELVSSNLRIRVGDREIDMFPTTGLHQTYPLHYPPLLRGGFTPGGYDGAAYLAGPDAVSISGNNGSAQPIYRFFSPPLDLIRNEPPLPGDDTYFSVVGGTIRMNLRVGATVVQSYTFTFPDISSLPLPQRSERDYSLVYMPTGMPLGKPWWGVRFYHSTSQGPFIGDVLHSVELAHGDARLVAGQKEVAGGIFKPHQGYGLPQRFAHGMRSTDSNLIGRLWSGGTTGKYVDLTMSGNTPPNLESPWDSLYASTLLSVQPKISSEINSLRGQGWSGDFDNGFGRFADGPFINKPDEGMMNTAAGLAGSAEPYNSWRWSLANGLFSPLRQIPSAVMFGSLPTGVKAGIPWRTLLFCPNPADPNHIGFNDPADHLLLDLFRMPVVEPYAISGPASTDGKVNLNYAIAPFSYIRRASAWYALLEPLKLFAIPDNRSAVYKSVANTPVDSTNYRRRINIPETLRQFEERFAEHDIFRSATEICSLFLVPEDSTLADMTTYWASHQLTGDNSREKPYAELYPKLTTQSNTYRVHMRVQILPPSASIPAGEGDFKPLAEYRGSRLIERYLDPENPVFSTVNPDESNLNELYQYRVLENKQFNP